MNKVKGVFLAVLVFAVSVPCFGNSIAIKRKKGKWVHSTEQKMSDNADKNNQEEVGASKF